jgi:hypothetical protein
MRIVLFFLLCFSTSLAFAQRHLTTLPIGYAKSEQLVAVIKPYLSEGSSVSVYQNQLILNATAEELEKTRELLKRLDTAPRQLLVSVKTESTGSESNRGVDIDTVIKSGNVVITNGQGVRGNESRTTVRIQDRSGSGIDNGNQSVRVTEGMPAYIGTGMTAPAQTYSVGPEGRRYYQQDYVNAIAGFYATTWVNDELVRVSIDQSNNKLQGQTVATQQLQSEVSGRLGEWIPMGALNNAASQQSSGISSIVQSSQTRATMLYIKVEALE